MSILYLSIEINMKLCYWHAIRGEGSQRLQRKGLQEKGLQNVLRGGVTG